MSAAAAVPVPIARAHSVASSSSSEAEVQSAGSSAVSLLSSTFGPGLAFSPLGSSAPSTACTSPLSSPKALVPKHEQQQQPGAREPSASASSSSSARSQAAAAPLSIQQQHPSPSTRDLASYAAQVIRNEAKALLALADRLDHHAHVVAPLERRPHVPPPASTAAAAADAAPFISASVSGGTCSDLAAERLEQQQPAADSPSSSSAHAFARVVRTLAGAPRHAKLVISGVGKSAIIARKLVATMCSLGVQATFLHPVEALHGDMGCICECRARRQQQQQSPALSRRNSSSYSSVSSSFLLDATSSLSPPLSTYSSDLASEDSGASRRGACDSLLVISHSGASAELARLVHATKDRLRTVVALTKSKDTPLGRLADEWLDAQSVIPRDDDDDDDNVNEAEDEVDDGIEPRSAAPLWPEEADSSVPAPTASAMCALAMGDALALALARVRVTGWHATDLSRRQSFARCHPGGKIGAQLGEPEPSSSSSPPPLP